MIEVYRKLERQGGQNKCGALDVFKKDQSGLRRCIKWATTIISVNASAVAVLNVKKQQRSIILLLRDLSHSLMFLQILLSINNINSHYTIRT
jgi:hypothetical protein